MSVPDDSSEPADDDASTAGATVLGAVALVVVAVGGYFLLQFLGPDHIEIGSNPSFIDLIFSDRWVVGAARLIFAMVGIYIAFSVCVLIRDGRPINSAGAVKADPGKAALEVGDELLEEGRDLKAELAQADADRKYLAVQTMELEAEVAHLRARLKLDDGPAE